MDLSFLDKPGREWEPEERRTCVAWLFESELHRLLCHALASLGSKATTQDAQDAWQTFCMQRLDSVMLRFDPARGRRCFRNYLILCLRRHCTRWRRWIEDRCSREGGAISSVGDLEWNWVLTNGRPRGDVHDSVENRQLVERALNGLSAAQAELVILYYFDGFATPEIARRLRVSEQQVRVSLHRARMGMRRSLGRPARRNGANRGRRSFPRGTDHDEA